MHKASLIHFNQSRFGHVPAASTFRAIIKRKEHVPRPEASDAGTTLKQISTFLCRLPAELRLNIYRDVFAGLVFQLIRKPNVHIDIPHVAWPLQPRIPPRLIIGDHPLFPRKSLPPEPVTEHLNRTAVEIYRERRTKWGLLLTCREIYHEAVEVFYHSATLRFEDPHVLLNLAAAYLPSWRLKSIRRLEIVWLVFLRWSDVGMSLQEHSQLAWDKVWHLVAAKLKLFSLEVCILISGSTRYLALEAPWVGSLANVRGVPKCKVILKPCSAKLHPFDQLNRRTVLEKWSKKLQEQMRGDGSCIVSVHDPEEQPD